MGVISRGIHNAFRNWVRTFAIVVILGMSIGLTVAMLSARQAVNQRITDVKSSIGNFITVTPAGSRGFEGGGEPLTNDQVGQVKSLAHITSVASTLGDRLDSSSTNLQSSIDAGSLGSRQGNFNARQFSSNRPDGATNTTFTPPIQVTGTDSPTTLQASGGGTINLTDGTKFEGSSNDNIALLGKNLADKNNLTIGSTFQAYGTDIKVLGIFDSGNAFANNLVVMPLASVQRLSDQSGDVTNLVVQTDSIDNLDSTIAAVKSTLGDAADVVSQQDTSSQALAPLENIERVTLLSLFGSLSAGGAIILLTMLMIVRERRREIGVLKAIGATDLKILLQFVSESVTLTGLGLIVGLVIGVLGSNPITKLLVSNSSDTTSTAMGQGGARIAQFFGQSSQGLQNLQASVHWQNILFGIVAALAIAVIGSALPAVLISRIRPAEVMRSE